MKKQLYLLVVISILITSCGPTSKLTKTQAYPEIYKQKPLAVLIMPPINRSTAVEAKEYFHTTLNVPLANAGYYVIPPFLSMEILKRESAYDSELFIDRRFKTLPVVNIDNKLKGVITAFDVIKHVMKKEYPQPILYKEILEERAQVKEV